MLLKAFVYCAIIKAAVEELLFSVYEWLLQKLIPIKGLNIEQDDFELKSVIAFANKLHICKRESLS